MLETIVSELLMGHGIDFEYENHGSEGEQILCPALNMVIIRKDAIIRVDVDGEVTTVDEVHMPTNIAYEAVEKACSHSE